MKTYKKSLFLFHTDLRLDDNKGLIEAAKLSETVIPLFIFDTAQVGDKNKYKSHTAIQFMSDSLKDLATEIAKKKGKLFFFEGNTTDIIEHLFKTEQCDALFSNRGYTPFALRRDAALEKIAKKYEGAMHVTADYLLHEPEVLLNGQKKPYSIFTPFYKKALLLSVEKPCRLTVVHFYSKKIVGAVPLKNLIKKYVPERNDLAQVGGLSALKKTITHLDYFKDYKKTRDFPILATTRLAAHLKFGTLSVRQLYAIAHEKKLSSDFIRQLYWRDFYIHIALHNPSVFGHAFNQKYEKVAWKTNRDLFKKWTEGQTGFPLVDAGMRELKATGFMHNRVRMVVASFLTKNLHISWQEGERYFATLLTDYDPAVNNGSWQWAASTGADAQPYFRIFNPWLQQKKFDKECLYIKKWVPELSKIGPKVIHSLYKYNTSPVKDYPLPIVDHGTTSLYTKKLFKALS